MNYLHAEDGKIHTRYSDLVKCTPGQVEGVVARIIADVPGYQSEEMAFGSLRHDMFAEESRQTKRTPKCFDRVLEGYFEAHHIEQEFTSEIVPDVVVHSRPDFVCLTDDGTIIDYKTATDGTNGYKMKIANYERSKQLLFYTYQLALHNLRVRQGIYLMEIWDKDRTEIIGYEKIYKYFSLKDIEETRVWARRRIANLLVAFERARV